MPRRAERLLPSAYALLGLLADGPAHGYDLHRGFDSGGPLAGVLRLEINQLYALLKKLAKDYGIPCISIPYDGTESPTTGLQLEAFMEAVKTEKL